MKFNDYFKCIPVLETDRLILRAFGYDDMNQYFEIICDPKVQTYMGAKEISV